jgi:Fe-S cluster assembly scaffold protein SufB
VVELYASKGSHIKYSTVQNWYAGDMNGLGGVLTCETKRGICAGENSKISWTQVESGSSITWKYPSVILRGANSVGEFYSVAITNQKQQSDTGTKMIHIGKKSRSRIVSKGISSGHSLSCYRGLVKIGTKAAYSLNTSNCDSMLMGYSAGSNTYPYIFVKQKTGIVCHEAKTSKLDNNKLFFFQQRGLSIEQTTGLIVIGFCQIVFNKMPLEFSNEVNELLNLKLERTVG